MAIEVTQEDGDLLIKLSPIFGSMYRKEITGAQAAEEALNIIARHRIAAYEKGLKDGAAK